MKKFPVGTQPAIHQRQLLEIERQEGLNLIWALFVVLLTGWSAGVATGDLFGGGLHLLLLGAVALLFLETLSRRNRVQK